MTVSNRVRQLRAVALRDGLLLVVGLVGLAFLVAAAIRRLNFDEALALRSGWLSLAGLPSEPPFHMPFVLGLGLVAHAIEDPGRLFLLGRLVNAGTVLAVLAWMLHRTRMGVVPALTAALLCLLQASFAVHAYELRYGGAILVAWMLAFGLIQSRSVGAAAGLGTCIAWLAAHNLKGVFFAGFLYLFAVASIIIDRTNHRRRLALLHLSALGTATAWVALTVASARTADLRGLYGTFAELATGARKVWPWTALASSLERDAVWWLVAVTALAVSLVGLWRDRGRPARVLCSDPALWAVLFTTVPCLFLFVHPRPWPYMLAPCAPFLAVLTVFAGHRLLAGRQAVAGLVGAGAVVLVIAYGSVTGIWPGAPYAAALRSPNTSQVETLRLVRRVAKADEPIVDPSGMAYFQPPCTPEWYLDTLFSLRAARGTWMTELREKSAVDCPWALNTYRLRGIPEPVGSGLASEYVLVTGAVAVARERPDLLRRPGWVQLPHRELESFWW